MKTAEQFVSFGQGNVEAFVKSGQIFAAGFQDISTQIAANAQASFAETMTALRALTSVRSVKEAIELQTSLARTSLEKAVAQTGHVAETSYKLAEQAFAPIAGRVTLAVEQFGRAA